ncbi:phosphonoacetaldehyde dehydrogenase [Edwardsiella ictaluri]|nr:phosphonoacetaldehyde dehydrogenase [Edwardsiella ictaluri]AAT47201.1 NAD-dependent aldehyde dehydrogenase [Edwardsiella ictaluri]KMQ77668.1 DeoR faimly transcriptional regulator [Edwardsiella ictaluri]UCQ46847.1 phosphonoacetaldehyde dehydrogenase [Edwardsiella ictaluri]BEH99647.1 phosphonoacetaldehyde dehydrogenase [Edwardsiella ictaluri]BEI03134.1 phosphonoacetaldehyde dehydrogenase [Edwardsiella ictaluri]
MEYYKMTLKPLLIKNPYTGETIHELEVDSISAISEIIDTSYNYRSHLSRSQRADILKKCAMYLEKDKDEAASLITSETGLSKKDTCYEIGRTINVLLSGVNEILSSEESIMDCDLYEGFKERKIISIREPLDGIIYAITPFNHPINQVAHKVIPAIATNNRIILKPSEKTPLSAIYFRDLLYKCGLPKEMFSLVIGNPKILYERMISDLRISMVTFTGGVDVGKSIACTAGYRKIVLELGGNDPLIIMPDADLERATDLVVRGSYSNSGQRCTAVKRVLAHKSIVHDLNYLVAEKSKAWVTGDPMQSATMMGTVIDEEAAIRIQNVVNGAIDQGARLLSGNQRNGALLSPTVLTNVDPKMQLVTQETFGPVTPIITFETISEAIAIANSTAYGLSSALCTNRLDWIKEFSSRLNVGTMNVWEVPGFRTELSPFGGIKDSGLGLKEGVRESMKNYTNIKTISLPWD